MRIVRPSSVDNVSDERIFDSFRQINDRIAAADHGRGQCVRDAARRVIIIDSIRRRGFDVPFPTPNANVDACRRMFGITPKGTH